MISEIFVRADGGSEIGLGHLVRCIALAHMLEKHFKIRFFCRVIPDDFLADLNSSGFYVTVIKEESEFIKCLNKKIIAIIDGYQFGIDFQKGIKYTGAKLVCIDDLHDKEFVADLIINHGPGINSDDYKAQPYTKYALGLEYALIRPAFYMQSKKNRRIDNLETLIICFGGSDPRNLTVYALQIALDYQQFKKIIVVTGSSYNYNDALTKLVNENRRIDHRHALNEINMVKTMLESEVAIAPASGIILEMMSIGLPIISGYYAVNQKRASIVLGEMGLIYNCGNMLTEFRENLKKMLSNLSITGGNHMIHLQKSVFMGLNNPILDRIKELQS